MEEKKKEETNPNQEKRKLWEGIPVRSCMLMCLAGLYLLYTGYRLCRNVIEKVDGGSFGFMIAGIIFLVIAVGMLYVGIRGVLADDKRQKAEAAAAKAEKELEQKESEQKEVVEKKRMTIADRANLTNRITEEED